MFNPKAYAFILYLRLNDVRCQRLIEKYKIPQRGARIGIQDLDLLVAETSGGKDTLLMQHPWMRSGYPILVNTLLGTKFFGFKEVEPELQSYHNHLDTYHASLQETKLPGASGSGGWNQQHEQNLRPAPMVPTQQHIQPPPVHHTPPPPPSQSQGPVKESKKMADMPVAPPPKQDPDRPTILVPEPTDWSKIIVKAESKSIPSEPLLSQQARAAGLSSNIPISVPLQPSESVEEPVSDIEQGLQQEDETPIEVVTVPIPSAPPPKRPNIPRRTPRGATVGMQLN